jgi:hypothetical protein
MPATEQPGPCYGDGAPSATIAAVTGELSISTGKDITWLEQARFATSMTDCSEATSIAVNS